MLDRTNSQRGFGALQGLVVLAVVVVIAAVAWVVYDHNHKPSAAKSTASTSTPTTSPTQKTPVTTKQSTAVANQNVETIPELGISITVPDSIKDLTYQVHTGTLQNGNQATFAFFSTAALTTADAKCGPSAAPLGSLEKANGQYPSNDQLAVAKYGQLVKQFPTFYISAGFPQAACSTNDTAVTAASTDKSAFAAAESTIQQTN